MDKIQITKNSPTTKDRVSENWKPNRPNCHQNEPKRRDLKFILNNQKELDPCIPITACSLHNITSLGHISFISTPNCDMFEALDFWLPQIQNHSDLPQKKLNVIGLNFGSKLTSLCYHALCATLLQLVISHLFQLWIVIRLNHWIHNFLRFKSICVLPQEITMNIKFWISTFLFILFLTLF